MCGRLGTTILCKKFESESVLYAGREMSHYEELETLDPRNATPVSRIEAPTPHKISVLLLVQIYLKMKKSSVTAGIVYPATSRRNFCKLLLKLIQYPDMTYKDLHNLLTSARYKIETSHMETFEKSMSGLFSSGVDALLEFAEFQNIERMLAEEMSVSQFSVVGLYIRRVGVIIERMSFAEMLALYNNIRLYYEKGLRALNEPRRNRCDSGPLPSTEVSDEKIQVLTQSFSDEEEIPELEEESILDTELVHLDRNTHCKWSPRQADLFVIQQCDLLEYNELRALPPIDLQAKLTEIIQDNPLNTAAYFLAYMNQLRLRDYFGSKDAMHRAFDRSPLYMMSQCEQKGFQYFCVNLAVLHANFGHHKEGLSALKESVMLAQDKGDKRCLHLANSWYCLLNGSQIDPLEKCLPKILEPGQVQPLSLAIQFVVKHGALCGYLPLDVFELLMKSEELNSKNPLLDYIPDLLAMRSALWGLYGRYEISATYAQLLLNLRKTWAFGDVGNSESVAKMLANLALWVDTQGDHHLSSILLQHAKMRFKRFPYAENWAMSECLVNIQERIHHKLWYDAHRACCNMYLLDKKNANLQRAGILIAKKHFCMARRILINLLTIENLDMLTQVRALILLAQITVNSESVCSGAIPLLIQASTIASSTCMEYELGVVDMILAHILLSMDMAEKAFQAITNSMERIYTNGSVYDRAKLDFIFVRAYVSSARDDKTEQLKRLRKCNKLLDRAIDEFQKLEAHAKVLDVIIYAAQLYDELEEHTERNKYAARFKQYYLEHPTSREFLGVVF